MTPHPSPANLTRRTPDYTLYLVTNATTPVEHQEWPRIVDHAIRGGVSVVQLRHKTITDEEFVSIGKTLREITSHYDVPLLVNDRVHLVQQIAADGAHLGQSDMTVQEARRILGPDAIVGLTVKTRHQAAEADPALVDYVGAGPVFTQNTKLDAGTAIGLAGLDERIAAAKVPLVAIGGISADNAHSVYTHQVAGVAVASGICQASDPFTAAQTIRGHCDRRGRWPSRHHLPDHQPHSIEGTP